jgi:hypothetical protein
VELDVLPDPAPAMAVLHGGEPSAEFLEEFGPGAFSGKGRGRRLEDAPQFEQLQPAVLMHQLFS